MIQNTVTCAAIKYNLTIQRKPSYLGLSMDCLIKFHWQILRKRLGWRQSAISLLYSTGFLNQVMVKIQSSPCRVELAFPKLNQMLCQSHKWACSRKMKPKPKQRILFASTLLEQCLCVEAATPNLFKQHYFIATPKP